MSMKNQVFVRHYFEGQKKYKNTAIRLCRQPTYLTVVCSVSDIPITTIIKESQGSPHFSWCFVPCMKRKEQI